MKTNVLALAGMACLGLAFTGCNQQTGGLFNSPSTTLGAQPAPATASGPQVPGTAPAGAAPYVLSAQSAGPYIDFSIFNLGTTDLVVKKEHFALLSRNSREVVPYDKAGAVIDLPQPSVVKPNDTLHGRAVFNKVPSPVGRRLVFKPDSAGTFADINPVTAVPGGRAPGPAAPAVAGGPTAPSAPNVQRAQVASAGPAAAL